MKLLKKKSGKYGKKVWLSKALYTSGGALVCAVIILPITLTQCNKMSKNVPVTKKFYKFANDGSILGWSNEVIDNPYILQKYNFMNLHGKTINSECCFTRYVPFGPSEKIDVFDKWACYGIDLSNTKYCTTGTEGNVCVTGYGTFAGANLGYCTSLNLKGTMFATNNMTVDDDVYTAYTTFGGCAFTSLKNLDLSGAVFAASNMTKNGKVYTAMSTFAMSTFESISTTSLETLDLYKTVFAANDMTASDTVDTAVRTFAGFGFTSLKILDLSEATFATAGMTPSNTFKTGLQTFNNAKFTSLQTLNLGNCSLGDANDGNNTIDDSFFLSLTDKQWSDSNKLKVTSLNNFYWENGAPKNALDNWFSYWETF